MAQIGTNARWSSLPRGAARRGGQDVPARRGGAAALAGWTAREPQGRAVARGTEGREEKRSATGAAAASLPRALARDSCVISMSTVGHTAYLHAQGDAKTARPFAAR